jgi:hypothetical protein
VTDRRFGVSTHLFRRTTDSRSSRPYRAHGFEAIGALRHAVALDTSIRRPSRIWLSGCRIPDSSCTRCMRRSRGAAPRQWNSTPIRPRHGGGSAQARGAGSGRSARLAAAFRIAIWSARRRATKGHTAGDNHPRRRDGASRRSAGCRRALGRRGARGDSKRAVERDVTGGDDRGHLEDIEVGICSTTVTRT